MNFKNKNVGIIGFGLTGQSAAKYLLKKGANITIHDKDYNNNVTKKAELLKIKNMTNFVLGKKYLDNLEQYEAIVLSPGLSPLLKPIIDIKRSKIPIYNDVTLFLEEWSNKGTTIGITGSNGKSTTATLIYELLKANNLKVKLGGSIGVSPLSWLDENLEGGTYIILEVGSALLECFSERHYFDIAIITNISSNHLDRYLGGIDEYTKTKLQLIKKGYTKVITSIDDEGIQSLVLPELRGNDCVTVVSLVEEKIKTIGKGAFVDVDGHVLYIDDDFNEILLDNINERLLIGNHNIYNILYSFVVLKILSIESCKNEITIKSFKGLPHRIEYVSSINGIRYFNDSKSTSPDATQKALEVFGKKKNIILIVGGDDKNMDFVKLETYFAMYVKSVILLPGSIFDKMSKLVKKLDCPLFQVSNLCEAVSLTIKLGSENDIVLLSPAAGSCNYFLNFETRGNSFIKEVLNHEKNIQSTTQR